MHIGTHLRHFGMRGWLACSYLGATLVMAACSSEPDESSTAPRFYEEVQPILNRSCVSCHHAEGIAPFALTDYVSAKKHAAEIASSTQSRTMPPMPVDNSGACNHYSNARWLEDAEIATLKAWANAGAPAGNPSHAEAPPQPVQALEQPDVILDPGIEYLSRTTEHDDYRCFIVDNPLQQRAFVTAYQAIPGDARVVHHVIAYQPVDAAATEAARELDSAEEGPGYTCFGGPGVSASPIALWAPGASAISMPKGTGVAMEPGKIILQIHYNFEHGVLPDRTRIALRLTEGGVLPAKYSEIANYDMRLQPGREYIETSATQRANPNAPFIVYGAMPHMHTSGRTLRVDVESEGSSTCLVNVDRWDFHWQNSWWYDKPLEFSGASSIAIRCGYDTRDRTDVLTWGEGTADEMCLSYFYVTAPPDNQPEPARPCPDPKNPLFGSCFDEWLNGCFAPDKSGECTSKDGVTQWSDGSKFINDGGPSGGFYSPSDETPCVGISLENGTMRLTRGTESIAYSIDESGATITCPDSSTIRAGAPEVGAFAVCRGISCPPE